MPDLKDRDIRVNGAIHFGTLRVRPVLVRVMTANAAEDPDDFAQADRMFDHVHARLIEFSKIVQGEIGAGWTIMVEESD